MYEHIASAPGTVGKLQRYLDTLDPKSRANLEGHIGNPNISVLAIVRQISAEEDATGFTIGGTAIYHRRVALLAETQSGKPDRLTSSAARKNVAPAREHVGNASTLTIASAQRRDLAHRTWTTSRP
ncbi:hypothetical protein H4V99_001030 [Cryobacterium sp. CG_9.6]|nr:hypothetical protein [Cryobacterium sp. CG_9.6]